MFWYGCAMLLLCLLCFAVFVVLCSTECVVLCCAVLCCVVLCFAVTVFAVFCCSLQEGFTVRPASRPPLRALAGFFV